MKALLLLVTCSTLFLTACNDTETGTELVTPPQQQEVELPKTPDVEPTPDPIQPPESEKPPLPPVDTPPVLPPKAEPEPEPEPEKQPDGNTKQQPDQSQNKQPEEDTKQQPDPNQGKQTDEDTKQQPDQNQDKQPDENTTQQPDQNQDKQPEPPVVAPDPTPVSVPPSAFTLTAPTSVNGKTFLFQWQDSQNADEYTLCRKNTTATDNCDVLSSGLTQTNKQVELNSLLSTNETYFVVASNKDGSQKSNEVSIEPSALLNAIGLLKASNTDSNDNYGNAVAVSNDGSTIAVSAFKESGIANDPTTNSAALSGAVYVYRKTNGIWNEVAYLKAPNADDKDEFGYAIALSGDGNTLAISTINEASSATGINGNQLDNLAPASGAVYLYVNNGSSWQSQAYIKSSNSNLVDSFGFSVSLDADGTTLLVGAPGESSSAQSINGDETDNTGSLSGAAYVFELQNNQWAQTAYLKSTNSDKLDSFGYDVALSEDGSTAVVGSPGEDSNATSVNGDEMDNSSNNSGAAYVFVHNGTTWAQDSYLKASNSDSEDQFGHSVDVNSDGTVIAIGAFNEASDSEINGNESDNSASGAGAAYLFYKSQAGWQQEDYIKAVNSDASDHFGSDVQLSSNGKALVVGAPNEASSSQGLDGDVQLNDASTAGAVYLFTDVEGTWQQTEYIKSRNTDAGDGFGSAIAISGDGNTLIVGAKDEASDGSDFNDNSSSGSGAAYIY